ncbi:protein ACTIVITY OF BC1 COMPLEX KINASE 3, chloroplastic-like [Salvia divinorum]|uniref:Protein ACTIVITY OF BC1 COMPLEX KINASE 3, chloroplastic-like n=1 Tax=Salvia divinorum TaxID=28513 RepID=A0ABD1IAE3_SALDI
MSTAAISAMGPTSWGQRRGRHPPRAALVEAAKPPRGAGEEEAVARLRDSFRDRADDMQAEAAAMARAADASVYSAELLSTKYGSRPLKVAQRALEIFAGLGSFAFSLWLDQLRGLLYQNQRPRAVHLRNTFTRLGPTFVKIGQGLSTRPDLCPPLYIEELSQLQDALPTFPDEQAFSCIERELGCSLDSVYSSISASPIAAASLGQVYKARLN